MANTIIIAVEESNDATTFLLYDRTVWEVAFDNTTITSVLLTVTYDSVDYTLKLWDTADATDLTGLDNTYVNLFGTSVNSYYTADVADLLDTSGDPIDADRFPDGYYEINITVVHTIDGSIEDTISEGFLSHAYCKATQLPLLIDLDDFDYHENRLQAILIALLNSTKRAAELGRSTQFTNKVTKINAFFDARSLSDCW